MKAHWRFASVALVSALAAAGIVPAPTATAATTPEWSAQFGSDRQDDARAVVADGAGNVYVVGSSAGTLSGGHDGFVRRYDTSGREKWTRQLGSTQDDWFTAVAVDPAGNVYVTGSTEGDFAAPLDGHSDPIVVSFAPDGTVRWTDQFHGSPSETWTNTADWAGGVAVAGDTVVVGGGMSGEGFVRRYTLDGTIVGTDQFVLERNADGTPRWTQIDAVAATGASYYVGGSVSTPDGGPRGFIRSYGTGGSVTRRTNAPAGSQVLGLAAGTFGVYAVGMTLGTTGNGSFLTSYDPALTEQWTTASTANETAWASDVDADAAGNAYVVGWEQTGDRQATDGFVRAYSRAGVSSWNVPFGTGATNGNGVSVSGADVYVTGTTSGGRLDVDARGCLCTITPGWGDALVARITSPPTGAVERFGGVDRIATAIRLSRRDVADHGAAAVIVAGSGADALVAAPLARKLGAPVLLTATDELDPRVRDEVARVLSASGTVVIVGGTASVSDAVAGALGAAGRRVTRYGGATRFDTALAVARDGLGAPSKVVLASGSAPADAAVAAPVAAALGGALLLTDANTLTSEVNGYVAGIAPEDRIAIGEAAAETTMSVAYIGENRYETAAVVARALFPASTVAGVANGETLGDAVAATAYLGRLGAPLLLTPPSQFAEAAALALDARVDRLLLFGGSAALSPAVEQRARRAAWIPG